MPHSVPKSWDSVRFKIIFKKDLTRVETGYIIILRAFLLRCLASVNDSPFSFPFLSCVKRGLGSFPPKCQKWRFPALVSFF